MIFEESLDQALDTLRRRGCVTYGALKRQFTLDDAYVADLKDALLYADSHVVDDAGRGLRWTGEPLSTAQRAFEGIGRFYGEAGVLWLVRALLQHAGRVSYRILRQVFGFDEARLADIYNWFTEGFDTADLQEAKTLLVELASAALPLHTLVILHTICHSAEHYAPDLRY